MGTFLKLMTFALTVFLFSCKSTMQVVSLENEKMQKNDSIWIYQDSVVDAWFYFYSNNGSDKFFIHNKTAKPVFFDLKNSFIASDNFKKEFWSDVSHLNGELTLQQYRSLTLQSHNPVSGTISRPDRIIMIPPNSVDVVQTRVNLKEQPFALGDLKFKTDTVRANWTSKNRKTVVRSFDFQNKNTPSHFRVFLTLSRTEDFRTPLYHDLNFWVSNIMEMDARQATAWDFPSEYQTGVFTGAEKVKDRAMRHPYKKSWRYYIPEKK